MPVEGGGKPLRGARQINFVAANRRQLEAIARGDTRQRVAHLSAAAKHDKQWCRHGAGAACNPMRSPA